MKKINIGSTFDSWLCEEAIHDETTSSAIKRVLARRVETAMKVQNVNGQADAHQHPAEGRQRGGS